MASDHITGDYLCPFCGAIFDPRQSAAYYTREHLRDCATANYNIRSISSAIAVCEAAGLVVVNPEGKEAK